MNYINQKKIIKQRVLYTLCFLALSIIDWANGSLNGRIQMMATNLTGIVIAFIILSSYDIKGFLKPVYALWAAVCLIASPIIVHIILITIPYKGQVVTATINVVVYGFILIRTLLRTIENKDKIQIRIGVFAGWILMLVLMLFSVNENIWPLWFLGVFSSYYLTDFESDREKVLYVSTIDGVIIGFFILQGIALFFRPYDVARYSGLYINPNFNALFYLITYSALLCKWFILKKTNNHIIFRLIVALLAGALYGFCLFTGSKASLAAMILVTIPFICFSLKYDKSKINGFFRYWIALGLIGIASVPIVYFAIRYMPTIHLHPLYFEGEYSEIKILPGEPRDSEKYVSFSEAMTENAGRIFYMIPNFGAMKVYAAELDELDEPKAIFTDEEILAGIDPIRLRTEIYRYYIERLNLVGHTNDYQGALVYPYYTAPHAHNIFIQMAFLYGIPSGVLFMIFILSFIPGCIRLYRNGEEENACVTSCFLVAFVVFGMFEIDWMCGQLPFTMAFLLFRGIVRNT